MEGNEEGKSREDKVARIEDDLSWYINHVPSTIESCIYNTTRYPSLLFRSICEELLLELKGLDAERYGFWRRRFCEKDKGLLETLGNAKCKEAQEGFRRIRDEHSSGFRDGKIPRSHWWWYLDEIAEGKMEMPELED